MSVRKYIGVDLGAWYNNKTRIAVLEENQENVSKLVLVFLGSEPLNKTKEPEERNQKLIEWLQTEANGNALISIDAPFAVPSPLGNNTEDYYSIECTPAMKNQYLYDNSARFVYKTTNKQVQVLAPTATLVGALTSRMIHIIDHYSKELKIYKRPNFVPKEKKISIVEVFPRATLIKIIEKEHSKIEKIPQYKNKKNKKEYFKNKEGRGKENMLALIRQYIENIDDFDEKYGIKTDDDYDAIICALTAYWVDQKGGYEVPKNNCKKFTNSFIYIPIIK